MTLERKVELLTLQITCSKLITEKEIKSETLKIMLNRLDELEKEFIKQYELPNLNNDPVTD